jgi:hypothetical protein
MSTLDYPHTPNSTAPSTTTEPRQNLPAPAYSSTKSFRSWHLDSTCRRMVPRAHHQTLSLPLRLDLDYLSRTNGRSTQMVPNSSRYAHRFSPDLAIAAARNLIHFLQHPSPASPLSPASDSQLVQTCSTQTTCKHLRYPLHVPQRMR